MNRAPDPIGCGSSYGEAAAAFDRVQGDYGDQKKRRIVFPLVLERLRCAGGRAVLDVGCGNGALSRFAGRAGMSIDGIDSSAELIEAACARDRRLGLRNTYTCVDVTSGGAAPILRRYDVFASTFAFQDIDRPRLVLEALAQGRERPLHLIVVNESWFALTSTLVRHSLPRRVLPNTGSGEADALSIADWGQGAEAVTYCRPEAHYRNLFRKAGLVERGFGYHGNSGGAFGIVQRVIPHMRPFWWYAGTLSAC